jgi:hypothetical protein
MEIQTGLGKKQYSISKITTAQRAGGIGQVVECLPTKCRTPNSSLSTAKKINMLVMFGKNLYQNKVLTTVTFLTKKSEEMLH